MIREFYADRDYDNSGSIVFARKMRKLDPDEVAEKCLRACVEGKVKTVDGDDIEIPFESICFHSDTPGALAIGTAVRATLLDNGVTIAAAQPYFLNYRSIHCRKDLTLGKTNPISRFPAPSIANPRPTSRTSSKTAPASLSVTLSGWSR